MTFFSQRLQACPSLVPSTYLHLVRFPNLFKKKHPSVLNCESVVTIVCFRGMCALEMTALELTDNGEKGGQVVSSHVFSIYSHHYVFYKFGIRWQQKPSRSASSPWRTSSKKISSDSAWSQTLPAALRPGTSSFTQSSSRWGEAHFTLKHLEIFSAYRI